MSDLAEMTTAFDRLDRALAELGATLDKVRRDNLSPAMQAAVDRSRANAVELAALIGEWRAETECRIYLYDGTGHCYVHRNTFEDDGREDCRHPSPESISSEPAARLHTEPKR